ncbi:MAG TPA: hypothetical protein VFO60_12330 [Candidatus Dormibacteraeota bacterium]|nr:hypothetical protein [Candidatus Dormibacteraeota bacterium]
MTAANGAIADRRLRVAFIGKGGSGKSAISGTVCRHLARSGWRVLALDVDTVPGLALSLGAPQATGFLPRGLAQVVQGRRGRYWKVMKGAGPAHLVDTHAATTPDGVRLLELGKIPDRVHPDTSMTFRHVMKGFRRPGWAMVADLAAGTRQPVFGWAEFAPVRIVVAEPTAKGLLTARRLVNVATHLVVNKVRSDADLERAAEYLRLPLVAAVPYDDVLAEGERQGMAPIDYAPDSPAVRAAAGIASWLEETL